MASEKSLPLTPGGSRIARSSRFYAREYFRAAPIGAITQETRCSGSSACFEVGVTTVILEACARLAGQRTSKLATRLLQSGPLELRSTAWRNIRSEPESSC